MNLFLKIFLWFLAAITLMVGVVLFLNWTVQTEPVVSRWRVSVRNQTNIYAETAAQIYDQQGEGGLLTFLDRLRRAETVSEVDVIGPSGKNWSSSGVNIEDHKWLVDRALASQDVVIEMSPPDTALSAKSISFRNGEPFVLIVRWDRPRPAQFFGESPLRYLRFGALFLIALLLCWALARYLSSPIGKIRRATQRFAAGNLRTRVADEIGGRHDELGNLARDFDVMAERIESLITSQQRLSRDISHELRSPLARLNVALEIAKQRSGPETSPLLSRIETESQRLNEMIGRLLTLAALESGTQEYERRDLNLTGVVESAVSDADFEANAVGKSVKIRTADECTIKGNENLIRSAVENVIRNAIRYTPEGTSVDVTLTASNGSSSIEVQDHGGGVPEAELANIFRPFYRVGEARERKTGGIGLGLAIAERAIIAHKGKIEARNSGDGLLVSITLGCN